ncbi:hypothetical protein [Streptomyces sp. IMTB 2501]|uniref:hypothetical protein n=1 Tax=Streptomyces sp. IMTB 2501 TaxID=1776340 RepID=UPI000D1B6023|nr:hypothetical protein [Streptomyces sp. IMTB 2501]
MRDTAALETALATTIRADDLDLQAEQRAVAAFRTARDAGTHRARARRRDDWRPPEERRTRRSLKMTFCAVFASLTLGGVAVAAIGSSSHGGGAGRGSARSSAPAPDRPGGTPSSAPSRNSGPTDGPAHGRDIEAHCRAYENVQGHGKALDAKAWQQLVTAAGGKAKVTAYCSEQLARATAAPGRSAGTGKSGEGAADARQGTTGRTGTSGNGTAGKGRAGGGKHK